MPKINENDVSLDKLLLASLFNFARMTLRLTGQLFCHATDSSAFLHF
jgi:hypothetical protein